MRSKKIKNLLEGLGRPTGNRWPRARFFLFCEGKNTEPDYFDHLRRSVRDALVEVSVVGAVGTPFTIASRAVERKKEAMRSSGGDSYEKHDRYWAVFDRDEHPRFDEAVTLCEGNDIGIARSNPCFEVWLILHVQDYDRSCDRHEVQRHLSSLHEPYRANGRKRVDAPALIANIELAEERARKQCSRREVEGASYAAPSTTVGLLTNEIRSAALRSKPVSTRANKKTKIKIRHGAKK